MYFLHTSGGIGGHGIVQLLQAELHVVEVGDGFAQRIGNVGKHGLEVAEGGAGVV